MILIADSGRERDSQPKLAPTDTGVQKKGKKKDCQASEDKPSQRAWVQGGGEDRNVDFDRNTCN